MNREDAKTAVSNFPYNDPNRAFSLGITLIKEDYAEIVLPAARKAAQKHSNDARMLQLYGLAARISGDSRAALTAFSRCAKLAPSDPLVAHSHARAALEAGKPAVDLFDHALSMAPADGGVLLGRAAAQVDAGRVHDALGDLTAILAANPLWTDGHKSVAQLRGQMGLDATASLDQALAKLPKVEPLHQLHVNLHLENSNPESALHALSKARALLGDKPWISLYEAHATAEAGNSAAADHLFGQLRKPSEPNEASLFARNLLRNERADKAVSLLEPLLSADRDRILLPYLALAWRMLGDSKADWLEADATLIQVFDIEKEIGDLEALARHLRARHFAVAAPLDQSVRGGTQTDGNLLLRDEPPLRQLKSAVLAAVDKYVAQLAPVRRHHPTLIERRDPHRIAGSWSVRLNAQGFHTDHVHSQGWISSAFYVSTPPSLDQTGDNAESAAGWLALGAERNLVPSLAPRWSIKPKPGRLVLFPSIMWHGTNPFPNGERLTVAFDIARPKQ